MPKVTTTTSYSEDDQLSHTSLNSLFTNSAFHSSAVDDTTLELSSGAMRLKAAGSGNGIATSHINNDAITVALIADDAVETDQIKDANVTVAKMAANSVDSTQYVDGSIDEEHLSNDVITGQAALTAMPSLTDVMLFSDADDSGNLKKLDFMRYLPLPKAYGVVSFDTSTPALVSAYNCTLGTDDADTRQILITTDMSSGNYVVQLTPVCTDEGDSVGFNAPYVYIRNAADFTIAWSNAEGSTRAISFVVFGTLSA